MRESVTGQRQEAREEVKSTPEPAAGGPREGERGTRGAIPPEIIKFLLKDSARSLIVRGKPGTGKTTFCLQCLEEIGLDRSCFYFSTRVSDTALYSQFPWLKEKEWRDKILDASRGFLKALGDEGEVRDIKTRYDPQKAEVLSASRELLGAMYETRLTAPTQVDRTMLNNLLQQSDMLDLSRLYERIERRLPNPSFLIIDSLDGLAEKYDLSLPKIAFALQKDLVENSNARIMLVLESESRIVDYMVDGVINMDMGEVDRRRVRECTIEKLRGEQVIQHRYLFTLESGRFRFFPSFRAPASSSPARWQPVPDAPGAFSTGNSSLDALLGGGIPRGSNVMVELTNNLPDAVYKMLIFPMALNFVAQGRGVMMIPPSDSMADEFYALMTRVLGREAVGRLIRIAEMVYPLRNQDRPHIVTLEFEDIKKDFDKWSREVAKLRKQTGQSILEIQAVETQETRFSAELYKKFLNISSEITAKEGDVVVRLVKPGMQEFTQRVANASSIHIKLRMMNGAAIVYCEKPPTGIYCIEPVDGINGPELKFIPIV
ncbi:MAG: gas vesicle protein GvpD P-loop domain-containing protein [Thermoplasmata archaeon]